MLLTRLRSFPVQLIAIVVFPMLIILMAVAYGGISMHEHAMQILVSERDERAVRAAAETLADRFSQRKMGLKLLADRLADGVTLERVIADNPQLRTVFDGGLVAVNSRGTLLGSWQPGIQWETTLRSTITPWVLEHDRGTPLVIANVLSADHTITLFGGITLTSLNVPSTLGMMQNNPETRLFLVADDGHLLSYSENATTPDATWNTVQTVVSEDNLDSSSNASHVMTDAVVVSSQVEGLGWKLAIYEPWNAVISPALKLSLVAPLAMLPAVILAMGMLWLGYMNIVRPLRQLGLAASRLAWGDYDAILNPVGGVQEIRDLRTTLNQMAQRLQQAQAGIHSYIGAVLQGQEDERNRLARDLHDDTLQALIALDQQGQMAQRWLGRDPEKASGYLEQLRAMIAETSQNLRRVIRDMRPTYIEDLGLVPALQALSTQHHEIGNHEVIFSVSGVPQRLSAKQELTLYRIAQEAIQNAIHHSSAHRIAVSIHFGDGVELSIQDDGHGFQVPERPNALAQAGHYGLMGMVERADQIGAQFRIDSKLGRGTQILVCLSEYRRTHPIQLSALPTI